MFTLSVKNGEWNIKQAFDFKFFFKSQNQLEKSQNTPHQGYYIYVVHLIKKKQDR
jgi:hypothetical protein